MMPMMTMKSASAGMVGVPIACIPIMYPMRCALAIAAGKPTGGAIAAPAASVGGDIGAADSRWREALRAPSATPPVTPPRIADAEARGPLPGIRTSGAGRHQQAQEYRLALMGSRKASAAWVS
jgi:hypothetical protein